MEEKPKLSLRDSTYADALSQGFRFEANVRLSLLPPRLEEYRSKNIEHYVCSQAYDESDQPLDDFVAILIRPATETQ